MTPTLYDARGRTVGRSDRLDQVPSDAVLASTVIPPRFQTGLRNVLDAMPNPDEILQSEGPDTYTRMYDSDGHLRSIVTQRMRRITGRGWGIHPFDESPRAKEIAEDVEQTFRRELSLQNDLGHFAKALVTGFQVGEAVWRIEDTPVLESIKQRHHSRFSFRNDEVPVLHTPVGDRPLEEGYKFIVHRNQEEAENPYGSSVLRPCYWTYRFKLMNWEGWLTMLSRFGVPSLVALFEGGADEKKARERADVLTDQLLSVANGAGGAFANTTDVKAIEVKGRGEDFDLLRLACNEEQTEAVLTATLTTNTGANGNRSLGDTHEEAIDKNVSETDREALATTLTRTAVKWQAELKHGEDGRRLPPAFRFDENKTASWSDVKEAGELGVPLDVDALETDYNIPIGRDPESTFVRDRPAGDGLDLSDAGDDQYFVFRGGRRVRFR